MLKVNGWRGRPDPAASRSHLSVNCRLRHWAGEGRCGIIRAISELNRRGEMYFDPMYFIYMAPALLLALSGIVSRLPPEKRKSSVPISAMKREASLGKNSLPCLRRVQ